MTKENNYHDQEVKNRIIDLKICIKNSKTTIDGFKTMLTRKHNHQPLILELFKPDNYLWVDDVMNTLKDANEETVKTFYTAFRDAAQDSELDNEQIFQWTPDMQKQVHTSLQELKKHGEALQEKNERKGRALVAFSQALLSTKPPISSDALTPKQAFANLHHRLHLLKKFDENKTMLATHRHKVGEKVANILSVICCGIPFLINRLATGKWGFFEKTHSEKLAQQATEAVEPRSFKRQ